MILALWYSVIGKIMESVNRLVVARDCGGGWDK